MKLIKILTLVAMFAFVTAFAACGKKDEDKKGKAKTTEPKAGDETPGDEAKPPPADEPKEPAAGGGDFDMEKAIKMTEEMADIVDTNKEDCAKMAEALDKWIADNMDTINKGKEAQGDPEFGKEFAEKYKDRLAAATTKMGPGMQKCAADPKVGEVMKKMQ
jgi:ABC-type Fe3+-citrate transport system substrate-binding protein